MNIEFKEYKTYHEKEILKLYKSVEWSNYYKNPEMLKSAYDNSLFVLGASFKEELIGIVRVVGDGYSIVYIQDIIVDPEFQRKNIGSNLIKKILEKFSKVYQIILRTDDTKKTVGFYEKMGFRKFSDLGLLPFFKKIRKVEYKNF